MTCCTLLRRSTNKPQKDEMRLKSNKNKYKSQVNETIYDVIMYYKTETLRGWLSIIKSLKILVMKMIFCMILLL